MTPRADVPAMVVPDAAPRPITTASWVLSGRVRAELRDAGGRTYPPGRVAPGIYTVMADFGDG